MSVCPNERSETIKAAILGLGMQILEIPAQRKFVSSVCHAHSNARIHFFTEMYCSHHFLSIDPNKFPTPTLTLEKIVTEMYWSTLTLITL